MNAVLPCRLFPEFLAYLLATVCLVTLNDRLLGLHVVSLNAATSFSLIKLHKHLQHQLWPTHGQYNMLKKGSKWAKQAE